MTQAKGSLRGNLSSFLCSRILGASFRPLRSRWIVEELGRPEPDWRMATLKQSVFAQVSPFIRIAVGYIAAKFHVAKKPATELVHSVLAGLLSKRGQKLSNPKRYLLRACRWEALRSFRGNNAAVRAGAGEEHPEILIALEEKDRDRFFGPAGAPERKHFQAVRPEHEPMDLSATVEVPGSDIRITFSLTKPLHKAS